MISVSQTIEAINGVNVVNLNTKSTSKVFFYQRRNFLVTPSLTVRSCVYVDSNFMKDLK